VGTGPGSDVAVIPHPEAEIVWEPLPDGRHRVRVRMHDPEARIWRETFDT
jgi:hypothetical protein